jgi:DNA (cytosine-5)-methyltransferase 1
MDLIPNRRFTVAELFCGCGGFSHGFFRTGRFDVVLGNDIKEAALRAFKFNHTSEYCEPEIIHDDIRKVPNEDIVNALKRRGINEGELDCLIGGPPCQGFSQMRRSEVRRGDQIVGFRGYDRLDQDPRNDMVLRFLEVANALRPKWLCCKKYLGPREIVSCFFAMRQPERGSKQTSPALENQFQLIF